MDRAEISDLVNRAIDRFLEVDSALLDLEVAERAISHQLARHLASLLREQYNVDCEYNRHFQDPKRLNLPHRDASDREIRATTVFPDIIVHVRNSDDNNLLVLELKKPHEELKYDELKLMAFQAELAYQHAAHLVLGRNRHGDVERNIIWIDS